MAKSKKSLTGPCPDCNNGIKAYPVKTNQGILSYPDTCDLCDGTGVWSDEEPEERFLGRYEYQ